MWASMLQEFQFYIYVIWIKSYVDGLFNSTSEPVWVTINKLNFVLVGKCPNLLACSETVEVWVHVASKS